MSCRICDFHLQAVHKISISPSATTGNNYNFYGTLNVNGGWAGSTYNLNVATDTSVVHKPKCGYNASRIRITSSDTIVCWISKMADNNQKWWQLSYFFEYCRRWKSKTGLAYTPSHTHTPICSGRQQLLLVERCWFTICLIAFGSCVCAMLKMRKHAYVHHFIT